MYQVIFYRLPNGTAPAEEFIQDLEEGIRAKALRSIGLLEENGPDLGMPFSRFLVRGIYELRIQESGNAVRVLYFFMKGRTAVLTHGFVKKTQTTPLREIDRARRYRTDFESGGLANG